MNRVGSYFTDSRANVRVQENQKVSWTADNGQKNDGYVRNLSTSGMLLETEGLELNDEEKVINFDLNDHSNGNFLPNSGSVIWSKPKGIGKRMMCGIRFNDVSSDSLDKLRTRVQKGLDKSRKIRNWTIFANTILLSVFAVFLGYLIWNGKDIYDVLQKANTNLFIAVDGQTKLTKIYSDLAASYQKLYEETKLALDTVTTELNNTKVVLADTQRMLAEAQALSAQLQSQMQSNEKTIVVLSSQNDELNKQIQALTEKFTQEIAALNDKIRFYEGDVKDTEEGRQLLKLYKEKTRLVNSKIRKFRSEAEEVRKQAMKERDRAKMILGNNGFFVKNGHAVKVDSEKYNAGKADTGKVEIQVDIVN